MNIATPLRVYRPLHPKLLHVSALRPLHWLSAGWHDLRVSGRASLGHGLLLAGAGLVLLLLGSTHPYFIAAAISGFLLVGPVMTTGVCELSRRVESGEGASFDASLDAWRRHHVALLEFGLILAAIALLWFTLSELLLRQVLPGEVTSFASIVNGGFLHASSAALIGAYVLIGGLLAVIVFVLSAVAVPLLIDWQASPTDAMRVSVRAVLHNLPAMLVWGVLLVALTMLGFATGLLGMIWIAPLLGHATWHAYRDLVMS
jgi:uncharacterized membrane protein